MSHAHEAAALTALGLEVARRMEAAGRGAGALGASDSAALVALHEHAGGGGESIDALRRTVGLTHSGGVRLVDRLAAAGLVERRVGADQRSVSLVLTPQGRRTARLVLARREAAAAGLLAGLTAAERATLAALHEKILASKP
jgi:MarR family transcriptional repressor of emrRAB